MHKTPDETKKGLVEAATEMFWATKDGDADDMRRVCGMAHASMADALALIQQLESERDELIKVLKGWSLFNTFPLPCKVCKNVKEAFCGEKCKWCREYNNFEWRGVQKEE